MTRYLTEREITGINSAVIRRHSPTEDIGVKELSRLESCVAHPKQEVFGEVLYPTLYDKAAILFELLIKNHCFYNGNKRTASMALYTFLRLNGIEMIATNEDLADFTVAIAVKRGEKELQHEDIVAWIKKNSRKMEDFTP